MDTDLSSKGIKMGSQVGFLDFSPEFLETLICTDPITDHFEVEHTPFARGKFAAVRRVRCLRTGEYYAAKLVRKRRRARDVRYETLHEAAVLSLARGNPRIIKLHKVFETSSEMTLILELASGGELQRVVDEEERIEERYVRKYLTHILTALRFLHSHNIAHLDLKPQNLLLTGPHPGSDVKLCDFGISRVILADIEVREVIGTPDYVAPEILQYEPISLATDMWSVGVLSYVLLTGHSPFGGDSKQETFLNISQCQLDFPDDIFEDVSSMAKEFISNLLVVEPGDRLTVDEALCHPWLASSGTSISVSPIVSIVTEEEASDSLHISSLKRSSSPPKEIISNKENNKNLLNSSTEETATSGSSPPSKRECREHKESTAEAKCHRSTAQVCLSNCPKPNHSTNSPKTNVIHLISPKGSPTSIRSSKGKPIRLQSPLSSPKPPRNPPKDCNSNSHVTSQIRNIELKLQNSPLNEELSDADSVDGTHQLSLSSLKAKFSTHVKLTSMPSFRRNNLNKSFGSVDHDTKEKRDTIKQSPACLRRSEYKFNVSPRDKKYGPRRDFQDLVIKNGYIY